MSIQKIKLILLSGSQLCLLLFPLILVFSPPLFLSSLPHLSLCVGCVGRLSPGRYLLSSSSRQPSSAPATHSPNQDLQYKRKPASQWHLQHLSHLSFVSPMPQIQLVSISHCQFATPCQNLMKWMKCGPISMIWYGKVDDDCLFG